MKVLESKEILLSTKKGLELTYKNYHEIDKYCKKLKIDWFASAWDLNSLKFLDQFKVKYHKIASAMIVDKTFYQKLLREENTLLFLQECLS